MRNEAADQGGQNRWPNRFHSPPKDEFGGCTANPALAGTHTAAGLEFGVAPAVKLANAPEGDVFATTEKRLVGSDGFEFGTQGEGCGEGTAEIMP